MTATLDELKDYYAGLLIVQYRIKPKAQATIKMITNQSLCDGLPQALQACFDLDSAIGNQLTILGKIVGVPRQVYGLDLSHTFFNFTRYLGTPASVGFGRYNDDPYSEDLFYRYKNFAIYSMTDFELRNLIRLKIIFNSVYSSFKGIKEALFNTFNGDIDIGNPELNFNNTTTYFNFTRYTGTPPSNGFGRYTSSPYPSGDFYRYRDYRVMTITYNVKNIYKNVMQAALYLGVIPRPMGVQVLINFV